MTVGEILERAFRRKVSDLRSGCRDTEDKRDRCGQMLQLERKPNLCICVQLHFITPRFTPLISRGCSTPSIPNIVGATSQRAPPERSGCSRSQSTTTKGTGFVVCAVWGPPVSGSII